MGSRPVFEKKIDTFIKKGPLYTTKSSGFQKKGNHLKSLEEIQTSSCKNDPKLLPSVVGLELSQQVARKCKPVDAKKGSCFFINTY